MLERLDHRNNIARCAPRNKLIEQTNVQAYQRLTIADRSGSEGRQWSNGWCGALLGGTGTDLIFTFPESGHSNHIILQNFDCS